MRLTERDVVMTVRRLRLRELRAWVRHGWIRPAQQDEGPVFDEQDVARIRLICDLRREMSLPTDAVPTILSLIDQVHGLRRELQCLAQAIDDLPAEYQRAVRSAYARSAAGKKPN